MSYARMKQAEPKLAAEVAHWLREAKAAHVRDDQDYGDACPGDELPAWVADKQRRLEKIRQTKAAVDGEHQAIVAQGLPALPAARAGQGCRRMELGMYGT